MSREPRCGLLSGQLLMAEDEYNGDFPCVIKPIRGRGSQGVSVIENKEQLDKVINKLVADKIYSSEFMIEPYLDGEKPYAVQKGKYI